MRDRKMPYNLLAIAHLHHAFVNHYQPLANCDRVASITAFPLSRWTTSTLEEIEMLGVVVRPKIIAHFVVLTKGDNCCEKKAI